MVSQVFQNFRCLWLVNRVDKVTLRSWGRGRRGLRGVRSNLSLPRNLRRED